MELLTYPGGHFDYYAGPGFAQIIRDELAFLSKHAPLAAASARAERSIGERR